MSKEGPYIRMDSINRKYELMVSGLKVYEFKNAGELHDFVMQALSPLQWSVKDFHKLDE